MPVFLKKSGYFQLILISIFALRGNEKEKMLLCLLGWENLHRTKCMKVLKGAFSKFNEYYADFFEMKFILEFFLKK